MEETKKLVEFEGEKGWLVPHKIKKHTYWYLHIYDPITQKTNKIRYIGKKLPSCLTVKQNDQDIEEVKQNVKQDPHQEKYTQLKDALRTLIYEINIATSSEELGKATRLKKFASNYLAPLLEI